MSAVPTTSSPAKVLLSTSSVYPETTASGFELAAALGYDGVELMVGIDPVAADVDAVEKLRDFHAVPVLAVHAPCLLVTQRTWGDDPWEKLARSAEAAARLGADTVVDEKGNAFYLVRVRTHKSSLGANLPIIPGMVAQVDILTGKKTVLSYLAKPILRAKANALTER